MAPFRGTPAWHNLPRESHPALGFAKMPLLYLNHYWHFSKHFHINIWARWKDFFLYIHLTGVELGVLTGVENKILETRFPLMWGPPRSRPRGDTSSATKTFPLFFFFFKRKETRTCPEWKTWRNDPASASGVLSPAFCSQPLRRK